MVIASTSVEGAMIGREKGGEIFSVPQEFDKNWALRSKEFDAIINDRFKLPKLPSNIDAKKTFKITNRGNKNVNLQFWDPEGAWKKIMLAPATGSVIYCAACDKTVHIVSHDGKQVRYYVVPLEGSVVVDWSGSTETWELSGATEVPAPPK
jgi:hypothetical protein